VVLTRIAERGVGDRSPDTCTYGNERGIAKITSSVIFQLVRQCPHPLSEYHRYDDILVIQW
jgi:hypothetical protein